MSKPLPLSMSRNSSLDLVAALAALECPVHFVFRGKGCQTLSVVIDGVTSEHQLVLNSDGTWHVKTYIQL